VAQNCVTLASFSGARRRRIIPLQRQVSVDSFHYPIRLTAQHSRQKDDSGRIGDLFEFCNYYRWRVRLSCGDVQNIPSTWWESSQARNIEKPVAQPSLAVAIIRQCSWCKIITVIIITGFLVRRLQVCIARTTLQYRTELKKKREMW